MVILKREPSQLNRILGDIGQGFGKSIPQGIENSILQNILGNEDVTNDPQALIAAIMGSPYLSAETQGRGVAGLQAGQQQEKRQQELEITQFRQKQERDLALTKTIDQLSNEYGIDRNLVAKTVNKNPDLNVGREAIKKIVDQTEVSVKGLRNAIMSGQYSTEAERAITAMLAKDIEKVKPGLAREILIELGFTDSGQQAKILHRATPKEITAMKGIPSMQEASSKLIAGADEQAFALSDTAIAKSKKILKSLVNKDFSPGLFIQALMDKGYDEKHIVDIFEPYINKLTPQQQKEFYDFKREKSTLAKIFGYFSD